MNPIVLAFLLLQVKHFLGDFVLQSSRQIRAKGTYGARAGIEHAALHALMTVPCLLVVGVAPIAVATVAVVELLIHYHEDWLRQWITQRARVTTAHKAYWILLGADQLVHQLTYVAMVWILL